jgi:rubrerythrin
MQTQCDLLDQAIETEKKGIEFYVEAADKASSARARDFLLGLADEERQHERILTAQRRAVELTGACSLEAAQMLAEFSRSVIRPSIIPTDRRKAEAVAQAAAGELEALEVGMSIERAAYRFYSRAAQEVALPDLETLYQNLAAWENGHFGALQEMHDFLADPEQWYVKQEHPIFEG